MANQKRIALATTRTTVTSKPLTPLQKTDYEQGSDKELRAAAKLLMVALEKFREFGGSDWQELVNEYIDILAADPERFRRMLDIQRGKSQPDPSVNRVPF
jgi:hypothetical protein